MLSKKINSLVKKASQHYQQILGFEPRRTRFQTATKEEWKKFYKKYNFNHDSEGIFLPRNLTAYLLEDSENLHLNLFHEYFGHGLFCEYSRRGKFLETLERKLEKAEKREFRGKRFFLQELQDFRQQNPIFSILQKERERCLALYETFAIWTEHYLSELYDIEDKFNQKYRELPKETKESLEDLLKFQQNYSELALFYEIGMPKYYDTEKIRNLLEKIFKDELKDTKLVLLYGSRKPYSDIDLFVVSSEIKDFSNGWLDIYSKTPEEFEYVVSVFDVSIINPLLTGELVLGDKRYLEEKREQLREQPITQEAIYYNLINSKQQKILAAEYPKNSKENKVGNSYVKTYLRNALALKQGKRNFENIFQE